MNMIIIPFTQIKAKVRKDYSHSMVDGGLDVMS